MTARHIQRVIIAQRYRKNVALPNYTPRGWFESDVFELTRGGQFREYEVKISRADFQQDALKWQPDWSWKYRPGEERPRLVKHQLLEQGDPRGPSRFWFACPNGLLTEQDMPRWAGLLWCDGRRINQIRLAPRLHREPAAKAIATHALSVCYWRYLNLWLSHSTTVEKPALDPTAGKA